MKMRKHPHKVILDTSSILKEFKALMLPLARIIKSLVTKILMMSSLLSNIQSIFMGDSGIFQLKFEILRPNTRLILGQRVRKVDFEIN